MARKRVGAASVPSVRNAREFLKYKYLIAVIVVLLLVQAYLAFSFFSRDIHPQDIPEINEPDFHTESAVVRRSVPSTAPDPPSGPGQPLLQQLEKAQRNQLTPLKQRERFANLTQLSADELGFEPRCAVNTKEIISAVMRADSQSCKQQLVEFSCKLKENSAYPDRLPNFCPHQGLEYGRLLGCFQDSRTPRLLPTLSSSNVNTTEDCLEHCLRESFVYAGLQYARECWCGNMQPPSRAQLPLDSCDMPCRKAANETCGGYLTMQVYETGRAVFKHALASVSTPEVAPVRIAYLMTLNGRDTRQAVRLLKMIYHRQHYYFIHIDSRQDHMYRTLLALESQFPNVRLSRWRRATIWGGASLLDMLLHCMEELLSIREWNWDYVLNLSESDLPVKRRERLTEFLTRNKGKNFLKSHGQSIQGFIMKQGLNHSFYECDHHLWRLGGRQIPKGVAIDGGSDWVCLYRDFVQYVTGMEDDMLRGLRTLFNHSLLPAESFFHMALRNSEFCHTLVDNNLHLTNWRRKQGCHCQHKYAVDWCGCSPNDFKPDDLAKIQRTESRDLFFARKFESIVSLEAVNLVEEWLYGPLPVDLASRDRHWVCIYHRDDLSAADDAALTFYRSVGRQAALRLQASGIGGASEQFRLADVVAAFVMKIKDDYEGTVVRVELTSGERRLQLEALVRPLEAEIQRLKKPANVQDRLASVDISSDFDRKEQIFRNFQRVLSVFSTPVIMHSWSGGSAQNVTVAVQDPAGQLAQLEAFSLNTTDAARSGVTRVAVRQPLRPGTWCVHVLADRRPVARAEFAVIPLETWKGRRMNPDQAKLVHSGPSLPYSDQKSLPSYQRLLASDDAAAAAAAQQNSAKFGDELAEWVDQVVARHFAIDAFCLASAPDAPAFSGETAAPCEHQQWSALYPDPKAELHGVLPSGELIRYPEASAGHPEHTAL